MTVPAAPTLVPVRVRTALTRLLAAGACRDFYLAGGTGLAFLLDHRASVDLDFFSRTNALDAAGRGALLERLQTLPRWATVDAADGTLHGLAGRVKVSFFRYAAPLVKPLVDRGALRLASLEDIGLMKLGAIIGRGSRKDFVDVYCVCRQVPLATLLALGAQKFTDAHDFTLQALKALTYFADAEREPTLALSRCRTWRDITAYFTREARRLTREYLNR